MSEARKEQRKIIQLWDSLKIMPMHNWNELNSLEGGNLRYLIRKPKDFNSKHINIAVMKRQRLDLMDEFFELVGDDADRDQLIMFKKKLAKARCLLVLGNLVQANWIKVYEGKILEVLSRTGNMDQEEQRILASKWVGNGIIDFKKITVFDYITVLKTMEKENKQVREAHSKRKANHG